MEELVKQYKLAKNGDRNAIWYILSNMGEAKLLKFDLSLYLMCKIHLARLGDKKAYNELFLLKNLVDYNEIIQVEPEYIKKERSLENLGRKELD